MKEIKACPLCGAEEKSTVRKAPYYRGQQEWFTISECQQCKFWFTDPQPQGEDLGRYYESEDYVSHTDGGTSPMDLAYKLVRTYALRKKLALVQGQLGAPGSLLDYGAGTGAFLALAKSKGWKVSGVEPSLVARENAAAKSLALIEPAEREQLPEASFDAISLWHVLEHLPYLRESMSFFQSRLRKGGFLFLALPNHESADARHYQNYWAALDLPLHLWHFQKSDIRSLAEQHQFKLRMIRNMPFDAFYVAMLSEKLKGGGLGQAFYRAVQSNWQGRGQKRNMSSLIYVLQKA